MPATPLESAPKLNAFTAPSSAEFQSVLSEIYRNQYFTNHGPLAREFEQRLQDDVGVSNVVTVGSESLAVLMALAGHEESRSILVPAFPNLGIAQIANWLNLELHFCDVDLHSHQPKVDAIVGSDFPEIDLFVLVETWGNRCSDELINFLIERNKAIIVVAYDSFGSATSDYAVHPDPSVTTLFSFGKNRPITTIEGGAIATNNEELAHRLRNIRSSYGVVTTASVLATCNGRFSEAQAGLGIQQLNQWNSISEVYSNRFQECLGALQKFDELIPYSFSQTKHPNYLWLPVNLKTGSTDSNSESSRFPVSQHLARTTRLLSMQQDPEIELSRLAATLSTLQIQNGVGSK